jgi:hypothetical protein
MVRNPHADELASFRGIREKASAAAKAREFRSLTRLPREPFTLSVEVTRDRANAFFCKRGIPSVTRQSADVLAFQQL